MRRLIAAVFVASFFAAVLPARCEEDKVLLYQADAWLGGTNQWWLPKDRLERLPRWKNTEKAPPLSLIRAIKIARKWIHSKGHGGDIDQILLRLVNPDALEPELHSTFFYAIEFGVAPYGNHITCVVLMDGTALEPLQM